MTPSKRQPSYSDWTEHALATLSGAGYRSSESRAAVVRVLGRQQCCLGAQEIFDALRATGRRIGMATVYRTLDLLSQQGLVQRLDLGGAARYEPALASGEHHHHLVCDDCGKVEPFADAPLERALARVGGGLEYEIGAHDVVLRGSCGECR